MRPRLESVATIAVVVAALAVAAVNVRQLVEGRVVPRRYVIDERGPAFFVKEWKEWLESGTRIGGSDAVVTVLEFADFECPFCRRFHTSYAEAKRVFGDTLSLVYVHYPLRQHKFARPAALAVECAGRGGRFGRYHDLLFEQQDSLGVKPWVAFALEAGVEDTTQFVSCLRDTTVVARIRVGEELGQHIGVLGTPTVLVNGWRFPVAPYDSLVPFIRNIIDGKAPNVASR